MNTVYKYGFDITDDFELELPKGARILHVDVQNGYPYIWALVDPDAPKEKKKFHLAGTGHPINEKIKNHIGTFLLHEGALVFHLFAL